MDKNASGFSYKDCVISMDCSQCEICKKIDAQIEAEDKLEFDGGFQDGGECLLHFAADDIVDTKGAGEETIKKKMKKKVRKKDQSDSFDDVTGELLVKKKKKLRTRDSEGKLRKCKSTGALTGADATGTESGPIEGEIEHSDSLKRKKKRVKVKVDGEGGGGEGEGEKRERKTKVRSSRTKTASTSSSSKRPEPEGANVTYVDEFDRLLNSKEQLFSDYGSASEDEATPPRRRSAGYPGRFIPCIQINSNSQIKYAIIGTELSNITNVCLKRNETELAALTRRIQLLEEELDSTSTRLQTAQDMLDEASKAADESERARKVLENKSNLDYERNCELEKLAKSYHQQASEWEVKYEEVARKNVSLEMNLATKEDQCDDREKKLHESDCQLESFSSSIKSFQIAIDKYAENEDHYEAEIEKNKLCIAELTTKYDELQSNYRNSISQINELEDENSALRNKYKKLEDEFSSVMGSLQEM
ncbi:tropomyosin, smooth muscle/fibroblast CTM1-like isoform X11 [Lineus longissimus]|uniref:tropomyosin, smooth muscle/fibroblast CTM1-like isoform X11 n=1 Tax=Lineus longissimus TaxID=88925 RepID=UPI00315D2B0C